VGHHPFHIWPVGQAVKTPPFHGDNGGSIPPRVTILLRAISSAGRAPALQAGCRRFDPVIAHHFTFSQLWPSSLAVRMPPCHGGGRRFKSDLGRHYYASIAQSVEQRTENPRVDSSILS